MPPRAASRSRRAFTLATLVRWAVGGAVIAGVVAGSVWGVLRVARPVVSVTEAVEGPVVEAFYATGTLQPAGNEHPLQSNIAGIVEDMRVDKGSAVRRGQVLAVVASDDLRLKQKQAEADLAEKKARSDESVSPILAEFDSRIKALGEQLDIARRELKRIEDLRAQNASSPSDLDRALDRTKLVGSDLDAAKSQKAAKRLELKRETAVAQAAYDIALYNCDQQTLRSPIDGVVLDRPVPQGTRLAIKDTLLTVADVRPSQLVMRAQVDEEDRAKVYPGQIVRMTLYSFPNRSFTGKVSKIYARADADRRTFEVDVKVSVVPELVDELFGRFTLGSPIPWPYPSFAPGMTGELAFVLAEKEKATVVPTQAVQGGSVWVVRDGALDKPTVTVGLRSVERTEILAGLHPGERVVISPAAGLNVGQTVRSEYIDPATAAGINKPKTDEAKFKGFGG